MHRVAARFAAGSAEVRRHRRAQGAAPGKADQVTDPGNDVEFAGADAFPAPPDGWWLRTVGGIYLWTPRTGAILIAEVDATPAGACA
jgi:hypothetical protein